MLDFIMLVNRHGKVRLARWYHPGLTIQHRDRIAIDLPGVLLQRARSRRSLCNAFDMPASYNKQKSGDDATGGRVKVVYRKYASLFFAFALQSDANVLLALELIQRLVETLDRYFGNVCELDLVYSFHKTAHVVDEMFMGGYLCESSAAKVLEAVRAADDQERQQKEDARRAATPKMFQ